MFDILEEIDVQTASATSSAGAIQAIGIRGAQGAPDILPFQMNLVTLWKLTDDGEEGGRIRIRLVNSHNDEVGATATLPVRFENFARARQVVRFQALPLPPEGTGAEEYHFLVEHEHDGRWEQVADIPLVIKRTQSST